MKKKWFSVCMLCISILLVSGCGSKEQVKTSDAADVTPGEYKGLSLTKEKATVSENEIEEAVDQILTSREEKVEITDRALKMGDTVSMNFVGKTMDGVAFDGGTAENVERIVGDPVQKYIDGFDDGLVGAMPGEVRELELTFPDPYTTNPDLSGQDVIFTVTIHTFYEMVKPELTDDFVKEITENKYSTVDAFKEYVKESLITEKTNKIEEALSSQAWEQVISASVVKGDLPKDLYDKYYQINYDSANDYAGYFDMELKDFLASYMQMDEKTFDEQAVQSANRAVTEIIVARAIAAAEGIEVTDTDIDAMAEEMVANYGAPSVEEFKNTTDMDAFTNLVLVEKIKQYIIENAKITQ